VSNFLGIDKALRSILNKESQEAHFISESCEGEFCSFCMKPATHKIGEEIMHDDPMPMRHNLTAYVCCTHFAQAFGAGASSCTRYDKSGESILPQS
jgi:hypothetical protein